MVVLLLATLLLTPPQPLAGNVLLLASHNPHSTNDSHRQVQCILQQLNIPNQVVAMPWRRAKLEVKQDRIDGYYTAIASSAVSDSAVLSTPLFLENWYWFWRQQDAYPGSNSKVRYGAILGSHQAEWLRDRGITPELEVNETAQLIQLLHIGRIDSFIADLEDFTQTRDRLKLPAERFQQRFLRYTALGVYFSRQRLLQRPGFISQFNAAAHLCAARPFALSDIEQQHISDLVLQHLLTLAKKTTLSDTLQQHNMRLPPLADTLQLDAQWQQLTDQNRIPALAQRMLTNRASELLRSWQANYADIVTEVILMDQQGANVAISQLTSDYWQGDETQFLGVYQQQLSYFIDVVEYDQSTERFQVKLSVPVQHSDGTHIGALSIGIDVERALTGLN